ncbi:unnamed protein product [Rotaria sp. Silwood1]|nr:unnamed protein product [Rotaria sp. Silwood1]CAF4813950.1 unnamed protein product [Rotaria sp. Silwood1]CAF5094797.1 unnamed protein product [Rotaria sp. Silwood1]
MYRNGPVNAETANSAFHQFFREKLVLSQYDDDDDADPDHLLDISDAFIDECIQNLELLCLAFHDQTNIEENDCDESGINQAEQLANDTLLCIDETLFLSNCISS